MKYLLLTILFLLGACNDCTWEKQDIVNITDGQASLDNPELIDIDQTTTQAVQLAAETAE